MTRPHDAPHLSALRHALIALAWGVFVFYGSLVPLDYRPRPDAWEAFLNIRYLDLGIGSRADWVANILLYVVLAYFSTGAVWLARIGAFARSVLLVVVLTLCIALAFTIEFLQLFFPPRTVSINDLIAETLGTFIGCAIWLTWGRRLATMWHRFIDGGTRSLRALLTLYALGYLVLSLFPYDFLISRAEFAEKFANPAALGFANGIGCSGTLSCSVKLVSEAVFVIPFGLLIALTLASAGARRQINPFWGLAIGALLGLVVETAQLLIASGISQGASLLTRAIGVGWGIALGNLIARGPILYSPGRTALLAIVLTPLYLGLMMALNQIQLGSLQPSWAALEQLEQVRFIPFYYHYYTSETEAVRSLLQVAASFAPLGFAAALIFPWTPKRALAATVLIAIILSFGIETLKLYTPGKRPDPTNLLIAPVTVWLIHWITLHVMPWVSEPRPYQPPQRAAPIFTRLKQTVPLVTLGLILPLGLLAAIGHMAPASPTLQTGSALAAPALPTYPPPEQLPPTHLPNFQAIRPRLPHPSSQDLIRLAIENPNYLATRAREAADPRRPSLDAMIFMALTEPGRQDIAALHERLLKLPRGERFFNHLNQLATAYDWLHFRWNPEQHAELQRTLASACLANMNHIRSTRLSPYEGTLYAGRLQAMMACAIALYRDHPQGETLMRFTHELWINRVLPVWLQVFGENGGWHEGADHLAAGIGRAIYTVPAMWRAATGENLFVIHPGFRGFLDFLVHRRRPDGTQIRIGDGAFFDHHPPDAVPLALEFAHSAAYSLAPPREHPVPTASPWGPLSEPGLIDPEAIRRLPLSRLFDGIGLLVARSDWSDKATYVTFKAGDHFWSRTHLDQGAFTLYKGGPLAIDSGIQGPRYGSPHHRNYAYQTIAHNIVTVTDPADTVPAPAWDGPRPFANDGGQRRIGAIPTIDPAPLDRADWEAQREIYHTGRIAHFLDEDGLTVALADLTPAYTNNLSGQGHFAHRTRRVERFWRVFGYDREDDVVVIYDDIEATRPEFPKRWLLHTIEAPALHGSRFNVMVPASTRPTRPGGQLEGHVLLPRNADLHAIGGRGFEFYVDGHNYDDGRDPTANRTHRHIEPGAWRIEIQPSHPAHQDRFLVVLLPTLLGEVPSHQVRLIESGDEIGAEIVGPTRTTRWWFTPGLKHARIEVVAEGAQRQHEISQN